VQYKHDRKPNQVHILHGIELPDTSMSYNPTPEAHQQAVLKAATAIVKEKCVNINIKHHIHSSRICSVTSN
jgi:hypothetical protein